MAAERLRVLQAAPLSSCSHCSVAGSPLLTSQCTQPSSLYTSLWAFPDLVAAGWRQHGSAKCRKSARLDTGQSPAPLASLLYAQGSELSLSAGDWTPTRGTARSPRTSCICRVWPGQRLKMSACSVFSVCSPCRSRDRAAENSLAGLSADPSPQL